MKNTETTTANVAATVTLDAATTRKLEGARREANGKAMQIRHVAAELLGYAATMRELGLEHQAKAFEADAKYLDGQASIRVKAADLRFEKEQRAAAIQAKKDAAATKKAERAKKAEARKTARVESMKAKLAKMQAALAALEG
jgi:ATPase subunit of ABC transporter with duplicated ATPase domains